MKNLNEQIKSGMFKQVYLIYGEESYLTDQYLRRLKQAIVGDDTMNYGYYEGGKIDIRELLEAADTMPFFAERRLIVVQNSGFFKSATEGLAEYIRNMPEYLYIIFAESEIDKRNRVYKAVSEKGYVCEMKFQTETTLIKWVGGIFKEEGILADRHVIECLISKTGIQMNNIRTEAEKLICYVMGRNEITVDDIDSICTTQIQNKIFDMITAIATRRQKDALEMYYDLLLLREPPMRILYLITRQFNMLYRVKELEAQRLDRDAAAKQLGVAGFLAAKYFAQAKHFAAEQIREALEDCADHENAVKTGKLDDKMAVELIIIKYSRSKTA